MIPKLKENVVSECELSTVFKIAEHRQLCDNELCV